MREHQFQFLRQTATQRPQQVPNFDITSLHFGGCIAINPDGIKSAKSLDGTLKLPVHFSERSSTELLTELWKEHLKKGSKPTLLDNCFQCVPL